MINFKPLISNYEYFQIVKPLGKSIHLKAGETVKAEVIDILPTGGVVLRMKGGMLTVQTEIPLQKDTSLLLKVLNSPSTDHKLKIQILGVLGRDDSLQFLNIQQGKIKDIISLISSSQTLKESMLETLFSLSKGEDITQKERSLIAQLLSGILKNESITLPSIFKNIFPHIKDLTPEKLKEALINSGIFFENKIKKRKFTDLDNDLKEILLSKKDISSEEKRLLKEIESYQILSRLTGGIFSYIPVLWEDLKRGDIFMKKGNKGKNVYFCRIDLDFKSLGKVFTGIFLFGKDLYLNFYVENEKLKNLINNETEELRKELIEDFNTVSIKFLKDIPEERKFIDEDFLRLEV